MADLYGGLTLVCALGLGTGAALLAYPLLLSLARLCGALWHRRRHSWRDLLPVSGEAQATGAQGLSALTALVAYLPALALAAGAFLLVHPIVTPVLWGLAAASAAFGRRSARHGAVLAQAQEAASLVRGFRSVFLVERSVTGALEKAAAGLGRGEVKEAALSVAGRYRAGLSLQTALAPLQQVHQPYVRQLALIIERIERADEEAVVAALDNLDRQLSRQRRLRGQARASFALISGTLRALQAANVAVLGWVCLNPIWRDFFLFTPRRALLLSLLMAMGVGGAVLFDAEIQQQETKAV